jgi:cysteinyl-tRNA synthetase
LSSDLISVLKNAYHKIIQLGRVLGLELWQEEVAPQSGFSGQQIEEMIKKRENARKDRDFMEADRIRDELLSRGIILEDRKEGTIWKKKD